MSDITSLSPKQLIAAAKLKAKIVKLEKQLSTIFGGSGSGMPSPFKAKRGPKKGGMSAAGRARIAAAQRARWAKFKAAKKK